MAAKRKKPVKRRRKTRRFIGFTRDNRPRRILDSPRHWGRGDTLIVDEAEEEEDGIEIRRPWRQTRH